MLRLIILLAAVVFIIWWGYQYNRNLPQRLRNSIRDNKFLKRFRRGESARQFQEWATIGSLHEHEANFQGMSEEKQQAFEAWLRNLDEKEAKALAKRAGKFCKASDLNLNWLFSEAAHKDTELTEGVTASVVAYLVAYWEATEVQDRAAAFVTYEKWQNSPTNLRNRAMTQALYNKLSADGAVPAISADLVLASQKKRLEHIVAAIQQVAEQDIGIIYSAIEAIQEENEQQPTYRERLSQLTNRFRRQPEPEVALAATGD